VKIILRSVLIASVRTRNTFIVTSAQMKLVSNVSDIVLDVTLSLMIELIVVVDMNCVKNAL
jgi:hypothetical protein